MTDTTPQIEIPKPDKFDGDANEWIARVIIGQVITEYPGPGRYARYEIDTYGLNQEKDVLEHIEKMLTEAGWKVSWPFTNDHHTRCITITHPWEPESDNSK